VCFSLIFPHIFPVCKLADTLAVFALELEAGMEAGDSLLWAEVHFGQASLGDLRRTSRLVKVAAAFRAGACCGGGGTITSVIASPDQAKAAYRLLDCDSVTHESAIAAHVRHVRQRLAYEPGVHLLIEDTTALAYQGLEQASGLGPIGEPFTRGFWLHSTLAVRWDEQANQCEVLGLAGQKAWAREAIRPKRRKSNGRGKESNHARQSRSDRESMRWAAALAEPGPIPEGSQQIYVADRESDIYEVFERCHGSGRSLVIRATHPRALAGELEGSDLLSAVRHAPVLGVTEVEIAKEGRTARLEMRSIQVELRGPVRPGGRLANVTLNVVQAQEIDPPAGSAPLCWTLITDLPVATLRDCQRVIGIYRCRWLIEELHKGMKTGLRIEQSQLSDYRRLAALSGIVSVVAVFLLQTKHAARTCGERELDEAQIQPAMLKVLKKLHPPKGKATARWFWISIARLGGFMNRKGDGDPGWQTLWRGWQTLCHLVRGYELNSA
jgi:hypothetical protein